MHVKEYGVCVCVCVCVCLCVCAHTTMQRHSQIIDIFSPTTPTSTEIIYKDNF